MTDLADELDQRTGWLQARRRGIGGSDVAAILGLSPWQSPTSIWTVKVGLRDDTPPTEIQEYGLRAEPMLKGYFEDRTGLTVKGEQTVCIHPTADWMRCTVDGFVYESEASTDRLGGVEYKTTDDRPAEWEQGPPDYYIAQAQWDMAVTGLDLWWFGVLHGRQFRVYCVERDERFIARAIERCRTFWFDHVVPQVWPEPDGHRATGDALAEVYDEPETARVDVNDHRGLALKVTRLRALKADLALTKARIAADENAIKAALGNATELVNGGETLATWRQQSRRSLDEAAVRAVDPELAEAHTRVSTFRVLRIKGDES